MYILIGPQRTVITLMLDPRVLNARITRRPEPPVPNLAEIIKELAKRNHGSEVSKFEPSALLATTKKSRRGQLKATNMKVFINQKASYGRSRTGTRKKG